MSISDPSFEAFEAFEPSRSWRPPKLSRPFMGVCTPLFRPLRPHSSRVVTPAWSGEPLDRRSGPTASSLDQTPGVLARSPCRAADVRLQASTSVYSNLTMRHVCATCIRIGQWVPTDGPVRCSAQSQARKLSFSQSLRRKLVGRCPAVRLTYRTVWGSPFTSTTNWYLPAPPGYRRSIGRPYRPWRNFAFQGFL
ncbi:unnamed protein product [Calypogeia fissa]